MINVIVHEKETGEVIGVKNAGSPAEVFDLICLEDFNEFYFITSDNPSKPITSVDELVLYRNNA